MSWFTPRNIAIGGGVLGAVFLIPKTRAGQQVVPDNFETPGVKNIGNRYSAGGGSNTHMSGVATPRGDAEKTVSPQQKSSGPTSANFNDRQADQKVGEPGALEEAWNKTHYGNSKGK